MHTASGQGWSEASLDWPVPRPPGDLARAHGAHAFQRGGKQGPGPISRQANRWKRLQDHVTVANFHLATLSTPSNLSRAAIVVAPARPITTMLIAGVAS